MFDKGHILYIVISTIITVLILIGLWFVKKEKKKTFWLRFWGVTTFILHISIMWVEFLKNGSASANDNILFPIYFCNFMMYMLLIVSFIKKRDKIWYNCLTTFTAFAGCLGALISLFYPDYYIITPDLANWGVLKSMLSHSAMLIGCAYLFIGGFAKIRVKGTFYFTIGMCAAGIIGLAENMMFAFFGLDMNAMYLKRPPIAEVPELNFFTISLLMIGVVLIFTLIYEQIAVKKGERWYNKIGTFFNKKKTIVQK